MTLQMDTPFHPECVLIKEERESDLSENEEFLEVHIDVNVKVENDELLVKDWCQVPVETTPLQEVIKRPEKPAHACRICKRNFTDSKLLFKHNLKHLRVMVRKETVYQCNLCFSCFALKSELSHHITVKHEKPMMRLGRPVSQTPQRCTICDKVLPYKSWHSHMREVHAPKPEKCSLCGEMFKCHRYLQRHLMYVHKCLMPKWRLPQTGNQEAPCDECGKVYRNKGALKTHKKNCHSTKPYECYICKSVLKCKSYLMSHMHRVHYFDGLEHPCTICGKRFKSPRYVKIHVKNCHSEPKKQIEITVFED